MVTASSSGGDSRATGGLVSNLPYARVTWYKSRDMSALEHMAQGRVLWLEAKTHDNVSISIVNVHQATAKRHDYSGKSPSFSGKSPSFSGQ